MRDGGVDRLLALEALGLEPDPSETNPTMTLEEFVELERSEEELAHGRTWPSKETDRAPAN